MRRDEDIKETGRLMKDIEAIKSKSYKHKILKDESSLLVAEKKLEESKEELASDRI